MLSLQALLCAAEPDDPQDAEVANMYKSDRELFNNTAQFWTECYAKDFGADAPSTTERVIPPAVLKLMEMGFEETQCRQALAKHKMDENAAVNELLSSM